MFTNLDIFSCHCHVFIGLPSLCVKKKKAQKAPLVSGPADVNIIFAVFCLHAVKSLRPQPSRCVHHTVTDGQF